MMTCQSGASPLRPQAMYSRTAALRVVTVRGYGIRSNF